MSPSEAAWHTLRPTQRLFLRPFTASRHTRSSVISTRRWPPTSSPRPLLPRPVSNSHLTQRLYSTVPPPNPTPNSQDAHSDHHNQPDSTNPRQQAAPSASEAEKQQQQQQEQQLELPSTAESRRSQAAAKFSTFMDTMQSRVLVASQALNDLTGYTAIEAIKASNERLETELSEAQATLRATRQRYKDVNGSRAATQREVTALLARKDGWTPADLERFTVLYRTDHELEAAVATAAAALTEAESDESRLGAALNAGMLRRYHEEQVWSDRIRRQSTWGTWGLMGVNVLLFLVLQFVAEPWRRARLVRGVADAERPALEDVRRELEAVREALHGGGGKVVVEEEEEEGAKPRVGTTSAADVGSTAASATGGGATTSATAAAPPPVAMIPPTKTTTKWADICRDPKLWKLALVDLYSERRLELRMRDATLIALEGAVAGATIVAGIALVLLRRT